MNKFNKINPRDTVIVAVSGGPDSMYLLSILCEIKNEKDLTIIVAHVNHKTRKECDLEEQLVKNYCKQNNIICELLTIDTYEKKRFTEEEARKKRLDFFYDLANKYNANKILTAHHGDDLIETILMKIMRGSTLDGIIGIKEYNKENNVAFYRPLLNKTKEEIMMELKKKNIPYAIDSSNASLNHLRNRLRNFILPLLKKEDNKIHLKFLKFSQELEEMNNYIEYELDKISKEIKINDQTNLESFLKLDIFMQKQYLKKELKEEYLSDITCIKAKHIDEILYFLKKQRKKNLLELPKKRLLVVNKNHFLISKEEKKQNYCIECKNELILPNGGILKKENNYTEKSNFEIHLNSKDLNLPLYITNRKDGMKIKVKNLKGTKKIKDILIDEKISPKEKDNIPIMIDSNNEVIWILGIKKSQYDLEKSENYDIIYRYERKDSKK